MTRPLPPLLIVLALLALAGAGPDEAKEPPLQLVLSVEGGEDIPVRAGEPFRLGAFRCTLRVAEHRTFALAGFSFDFPRGFTFEADLEDPDAKSWSFDGPNSQILIVRAAAGTKPADLLRETADGLAELFRGSQRRAVKIRLGGRELTGLRLEGSLVGQRAVQEIYVFTVGQTAHLLSLQDLPDDPDESSPDGRKAYEMIKRTFRFEARGG